MYLGTISHRHQVYCVGEVIGRYSKLLFEITQPRIYISQQDWGSAFCIHSLDIVGLYTAMCKALVMHVLRNSVVLQISDILKDPEILNLLNNMYTFEEVCYTSFDAMMKTRTC